MDLTGSIPAQDVIDQLLDRIKQLELDVAIMTVTIRHLTQENDDANE